MFFRLPVLHSRIGDLINCIDFCIPNSLTPMSVNVRILETVLHHVASASEDALLC